MTQVMTRATLPRDDDGVGEDTVDIFTSAAARDRPMDTLVSSSNTLPA